MTKYKTDLDSLRGVQGIIKTELVSNYSWLNHRYGGVDIIFKHDESGTPEHVGRPMVLFEMLSAIDSRYNSVQYKHRDISAQLTVIVSKFSGGQVGTTNQKASDERLSNVIDEILNDKKLMHGKGIMNCALSMGDLMEQGTPENNRTTICNLTYTYLRGDD